MIRSLITVAIMSASIATHATGGETEISFAKLPENVQKTAQSLAGKGQITKATKESGDAGGTIYEVAYTIGHTKYEAEISPKGKLIVVDEQIDLSNAPKAVRGVIEEKTAGGKIIKIEKATQGKELFYEAEFTKDGKEHEVKVAPDGKILAAE